MNIFFKAYESCRADSVYSPIRILKNNKLIQRYIGHTSSFVSDPEGTVINMAPAISAVIEKHYGNRKQIEKKTAAYREIRKMAS